MDAIRLHAGVRQALLAHAREVAPRECCGLLIGTGSEVDGSIRSANVDPDPNRYQLDPVLHVATSRSLRGSRRKVLGVYHSHPHSPPVPSRTDLLEAYYPDFVWIIVSPGMPAAESVAAYRLAGEAFVEVNLLVVEGERHVKLVESIRSEYLRYKKLAEDSIAQASDAQLTAVLGSGSNSIATICWHVSGNLKSRFTDFLTSDGEKPWRNREEEFDARHVSRAELQAKWEEGWRALLQALDGLSDLDLDRQVTIRGQSLSVIEALHRSLAHTSQHVGQIVFIAKAQAGESWKSLSIPRGQSDAFNRSPR